MGVPLPLGGYAPPLSKTVPLRFCNPKMTDNAWSHDMQKANLIELKDPIKYIEHF
jgi:hypothetical protein